MTSCLFCPLCRLSAAADLVWEGYAPYSNDLHLLATGLFNTAVSFSPSMAINKDRLLLSSLRPLNIEQNQFYRWERSTSSQGRLRVMRKPLAQRIPPCRRSPINSLPHAGECSADSMLSSCPDGSEQKFYLPDCSPRICCLSRKHYLTRHINQVHQQIQAHLLHCFLMSCISVFLGEHPPGSRNVSGPPLPLPTKHLAGAPTCRSKLSSLNRLTPGHPGSSQPLTALRTPAFPSCWCSDLGIQSTKSVTWSAFVS